MLTVYRLERDLSSLLDLAVPDAGGADLHALGGAIDECANGLKIDVPATIGHIVGVADSVAELRTATADFTLLCHWTEIS